jgi:methylmalonyl-CoA mutase C-terminal domain/subunit
MTQGKKYRILIAKPGLDGHDRGVKVIAKALSDAGFEVIYTGLHRSPEDIVSEAIQEDVDMIGLSSLSGGHKYLFPRIMELLKENDINDIDVIGGGIFPEKDIKEMEKIGIKKIFTPGDSLNEITAWVRENIGRGRDM